MTKPRAIGLSITIAAIACMAFLGVFTTSDTSIASSRSSIVEQAEKPKQHVPVLPANIHYGSDGVIVLPDGAKLEISDGYITAVQHDANRRLPYGNVIGSSYVVGSLDLTDVTRELWRYIDVEIAKADGSIAKISMARPLWWMEAMHVAKNSFIKMNLQEAGIEGSARVLDIRDCDVDSREAPENMNIVIGKIEHANAIVFDLIFDGDTSNPLGVTANHPLYSIDRHGWLPAGELKIDEKVETVDGTATLTGKSCRPGRHTVYNLEVHRSHAYYVSKKGVLAHNTGMSCFNPNEKAVADYLEGLGRKVTKNPLEGAKGAGRQGDAFVDGKLHEFKTLDPGATAATIKNSVNNSIRRGGQARDIVIDSRGTGLTEAAALHGIKKALGISRGLVDYIAVIGDDFFIGRGL